MYGCQLNINHINNSCIKYRFEQIQSNDIRDAIVYQDTGDTESIQWPSMLF